MDPKDAAQAKINRFSAEKIQAVLDALDGLAEVELCAATERAVADVRLPLQMERDSFAHAAAFLLWVDEL